MVKNLSVLFNLIIGYLICAPFNVKGNYYKYNQIECPVIGISLGTTNTCVGVFLRGYVSIIPNELGSKITPSIVAYTDEKMLIGESAKQQAVINDRRTLYDVKRLIGRKYTDPTIQKDKDELPYEIVEKNNKPYIKVKNEKSEDQLLTPEEISAMFLVKIKEIAETFLGKTVSNAVITVPAYFNETQRQSTRDAGTIAGLNVLRILNEPTAAAIAYGIYRQQGKKNILVYDLGGSNLNVSIMAVDNGVLDIIATSVDTNLGGADLDKRVTKYFIKLLILRHNKDITQDKRAIQKLKREVEIAKIRLSSSMTAEIEIKDLVEGFYFKHELTRTKFESINSLLFKKAINPLNTALEDSGLQKSQIDEIILVGGSTKIPKIRNIVQEFFGMEINIRFNPDEAVAYGAAVQGAIICGETAEEIAITTPLSLGIETAGGVMSNIIHRDSMFPLKKSQVFTTHFDNQKIITIKIFEGERPMAKDNHFLGKFDLTGLPAATKGQLQIEVTFEVDLNGQIIVKAEEKSRNIQSQTTISDILYHLSKEEIDKILLDSQTHEAQDQIIKERIQAKNSLDSYISYLRNITSTDSQVNETNNVLKETESWLNNNQFGQKEEYQKKKMELENISKIFANNTQEYGEYIYSLSLEEPNSDL